MYLRPCSLSLTRSLFLFLDTSRRCVVPYGVADMIHQLTEMRNDGFAVTAETWRQVTNIACSNWWSRAPEILLEQLNLHGERELASEPETLQELRRRLQRAEQERMKKQGPGPSQFGQQRLSTYARSST